MYSWLISIMTPSRTFTCRMIPIQVICSGIRATAPSWKAVWRREWVRVQTVERNPEWAWRRVITTAMDFSTFSRATSQMTYRTFTATGGTVFLRGRRYGGGSGYDYRRSNAIRNGLGGG